MLLHIYKVGGSILKIHRIDFGQASERAHQIKLYSEFFSENSVKMLKVWIICFSIVFLKVYMALPYSSVNSKSTIKKYFIPKRYSYGHSYL
jgi:hypothetical protein